MKLKHFKKHTFSVCMDFVYNTNRRNIRRLYLNLTRWARVDDGSGQYDYSSTFSSALERTKYLSDRMNQGRAIALMALLWRDYPRFRDVLELEETT
jgi:hypothetical protein